jgi:hypothetical protein
MGTTQLERYRRRVLVADLARGGMPPADIAKKLGASKAFVQKIIRHGPDWQDMTPGEEQQAASLLEARRLHAIWRKSHVKLCADYPDGACDTKHGLADLCSVEMPDDRHAFVCRGKLGGNWKALGFAADP